MIYQRRKKMNKNETCKKLSIYLIIVLVLGTGLAGARSETDVKATDRVVITLHSQMDKDNVIKAVQDKGGKFVRETLSNELIFNIPAGFINNQISILTIPGAANIEEDGIFYIPPPIKNVESVQGNIQMDQLIPNDPLYSQQWGMPMIGANKMWDVTTGVKEVIVAVIDSGVDYNHEDLAAVNKSLGFDFVNNDNDPMDDNGHGTHVAGIIAATMNNGKGVVGVAPGVTVMPVKVCNNLGKCLSTDMADGVRWAVDHGAKIISISLGGTSSDRRTSDATKYAVTKGSLVIAAAGNSGKEAPSYPGAYPWVIAVGAIDSTAKRASYSQYGSFLDIMGPGSNIISTVPKGSCELCDPSGYSSLSGTSMATPHVSGVVALYWSNNTSLTNKQVAINLVKSADDLGTPGRDKYYGYGRVDAYQQDG
jgi:type VII secretion-associated serine protease mycosin